MHQVIQPIGKMTVQLLWEYKFTVERVEPPEDDRHEHADGEGGRGKDDIFDSLQLGLLARKICENAEREEDKLETHVEEGQVLRLVAE